MRLKNLAINKDAWALLALVLLTVLLPVGIVRSQAAFVAGSANPGSVFSSASSFNTVVVSITDPGTPLRGSINLNAVATSDRGITGVVFETSPAGAGTWTTACSDNNSPYGCTWNTTAVADGLRDIRVTATDAAGYSRTATVTNRRVDNTAPTATTTDPGSPKTGIVSVTGTAVDGAGSGVATTKLQYSVNGAGAWVDICSAAAATVNCSWNTAALADGLYDLRTVATDVAGNTGTSTVVAARRLDNLAPTATMTAPATNLKGTITLASTSADSAGGSGVASVRYEYKPNPGSTWTTACTGSTSPFSCSFDTTGATDGQYDFRAVATDGVGLTGTSTAVTLRRIDNTAPTATMGAVAANLSGPVTLTSTLADSGVGVVASAQYQYKLTSDSTWTNACSSAATPWSCSFNTASVTDGVYDFRVVAADTLGNSGPSAAVTNKRIDNTNPTVTMGALPAWVDGTITLTSTPADGGGIASVRYEYRTSPAGAWQFACTSAASPYSCAFSTATLGNLTAYDFHAIATDNAAKTATSGPVTTRIDRTSPTVTMTSPAANLAGSVTLASTAADTGSGVASVQYQYRLGATGAWTNACSSSTTPYSCAFNTASIPDGLYNFQAIVTDNVGRATTSATVTNIRIDNTNPITATLTTTVGTNLSGTITFNGAAADNAGGSGIATWKVQTSPTGTNTWTDLPGCTDSTGPFTTTTCNGNVDGLADGVYDFRALATDLAGNTLGSTVQTNRRVDTDGPVTSVGTPVNNARVSGNVTMTANATDPAGVARVDFQVFLGGTWFTFCTDNTASYSCTGDSTAVADGTYQTRVVATDSLGHATNSPTITLIIDNTHPSASDVQATNGGTAGRVDAGDVLTFTYSEVMDPTSILTGWDGSLRTGMSVRVVDGAGTNSLDTLEVRDGATTIGTLGTLQLRGDFVDDDVTYNATIQRVGNGFAVTLGTLSGGSAADLNTVASSQMRWTPSAAAKDLAGNTSTTTLFTEGTDRDF